MCHPIKGKVLCTENRAKSIIAIIAVLCVISAASTTFEHQLHIKTECLDWCNNTEHSQGRNNSQFGNSNVGVLVFMYLPLSNNASSSVSSDSQGAELIQQIQNYSSHHNLPVVQVPCLVLPNIKNHSLAGENPNKTGDSAETEEAMSLTKSKPQETPQMINGSKCCKPNVTIGTEETNLSKNKTYQATIHWFNAIVFVLLPLVLIATFNSFLVKALYKSHHSRKEMTNSQVSFGFVRAED